MKKHSSKINDQIISERRLLRTTPLTEQDVDDAVDDGKLDIVGSESGARFYRTSQVEKRLNELGYNHTNGGRNRGRPAAAAKPAGKAPAGGDDDHEDAADCDDAA